jgi:hypothetical protein
MSFLPKDYKDPGQTSSYLKLKEGNTKIRMLGDPILGWEYWVEDEKRKPFRVRDFKDIPEANRSPADKKNAAKFFWAMLVWNYNDSKAQIFEITQVGIRRTIENLNKDEAWGDPKNYDLSITRTGEGMDTEYTVVPTPPKAFDKTDKFIPAVNLEAWFEGGDPFDKDAPTEKIEDEELKDIMNADLDSELKG